MHSISRQTIKTTISQMLQMYRLDVALISFCAYGAGLVFNGGAVISDLPAAIGISLLSFNYIYSLNAIEDRDIDSINKPDRPISAGKLNILIAQRYVSFLLISSLVYPFFVYKNPVNLVLYFFLPILGWAYSVPPLRLKTKLLPAVLSIALMYLTPVVIGITASSTTINSFHGYLLGYIFLFIISIVPLKDIEDVEGDQRFGSSNWMAILGRNKLLTFSTLSLAASIVFILAAPVGEAITFDLTILSSAIISLIAAFFIFKRPIEYLYRSILILVGMLGAAFFIFFLIIGKGIL